MEKYNLEQTGQEVQNILNEATPQSELTAETERAQEAERLLGEGIQHNADDIDAIEGKIPSAATSENKLADKEYVDGQIDDEKNRAQGVEGTLQDNIDAEETRAKAAEKQNADDIDALEAVVPSGATSENKLATESYVNDAVATSSATFHGTFNLVSDLHLTLEATHANIATALAAAIATADNNDFAFVLIPTDAETPTVIGSIERYKYNGTDWAYEYTLNNSGFTQAQWDAINSGITSGDVAKLAALPTNAQLTTLLTGLQSDIDGEEARAKGAEGTLQDNIDAEEARAKAAEKQNADDIDAIEAVLPENASSENKVATESEIDSLSAAIEAILLLIPSAASSLNKLADKAFVNSSIATNTATFRGTFNLVNDLNMTLAATHAQIGNALSLAIQESDNNDYAFVQVPTAETAPNEIAQTDRYKFNGTSWEYEYTLNNSGFTSAQWVAINSGITSSLVTKLSDLPTNAQLTTELGTLTSGITAINQKIPAAAAQNNKLVDTAALESYIVQVLGVLTVSYNITSTDGHVTLAIQQTDGKITSVSLTTSDIASAAALNLKASQADLTALASRVTTAEGNITTLGGRVSTNETDIAQLQAAYEALTQSDIIIGALPASGVANKIYRVPGTSSYSDYMWNGSTWVLMATYNNAIDDEPTPGSNNLVKSGGVLNSIIQNGPAFDLSAYNAVGGVLATYADLSAAITALNALDAAYKQPGMSLKFVRSSDNKYVQYFLTKDEWSANEADWEKVNLEKEVSQLDQKVNGFESVNEITGVGTQDISLFQPFIPYPNFKVEQLPDMASPFTGILTKYTKVTTDAANRYCAEPRDSRDGYPTRVTISLWLNEDEYTDWNTNWTDYFDFIMATYTPSYTTATMRMYIKNILAQTLGETKNWLSLGAYSTRVSQIGKWHQIVVYKDFSVSWTKWSMMFNFGNHANKTFSIVNPQIVFGDNTIPAGIVVLNDVANIVVPYPLDNYSTRKKINYLLGKNAENSSSIDTLESEVGDIQDVIEPLIREKTNVLEYYKAGETVFIESQFNEQNKIRSYVGWSKSEVHGSFTGNGLFGFAAMQFVSNNQATTIYSPTDDIAPAYYNGTYIGGNHGCSDVRKITVQGHGKTYADIGSKWSNGSKNFYIINIPDENTLWMLGENEAIYPKWSFPKVASGDTLTHISGATHTGSMSVSTSEVQQMLPAIDLVSRRTFVDGKEITDIPDRYSFAEFVLVEIYDVMNPASVLEKIKDGVGTFTDNPMFYNLGAEYVARHTLTYRFTSSYQCFIETNISFYQDVDFAYFALTQFGAMPNSPKIYIPKSLPVNNVDYRTFQNMQSADTSFPESAWENPNLPIDRVIEKNGTIAAEIGFLFDYGDAGVQRKDNITIAMQLASSNKIYPHFVDKPTQMPAGSGFNGVAMRRYIDIADIDKNGVLAIQQFEYEGKYYIYADYNLAGTYKISIPGKWRGKQVSVFEKSDNVALMTELANDELLVMVKTASPMYGYLVAQIK